MTSSSSLLLSTLVEDIDKRFWFGGEGRIFCMNPGHESFKMIVGTSVLDLLVFIDRHWSCSDENRS